MKKIILTSIAIASILIACKSSKETTSTKSTSTTPPATMAVDCSTQKVTSAEIKTILETNCGKCHNSKTAKAGIDATSIESIKTNSGAILGSIKYEDGYMKMPKYAAKLDQAIIDKIQCWVNNGMKD